MAIYRIKRFSKKKDPEDVTIRLGRWDNKKRLGDLTDKQLKNIAQWNHKTDKQKKNVRNNALISGTLLSGSSAALGSVIGGKKGATIGAISGIGTQVGMSLAGNKLHKKQANAAEKVLKNRRNHENR